MTNKSTFLLSVLALLPMLATTAEAGRRNPVAQKAAPVPARIARQSIFDFNSWTSAVSSQIALNRNSGGTARVKADTVAGRTLNMPIPLKAPANSQSTPPAPLNPPAIAAAAVAPAQRRIKNGNPVVLLLVPKPVFSGN